MTIHSKDTVDPRDGGFGGRLWRWKWENESRQYIEGLMDLQ